jgi:predicted enzyme related to lactoylglutathione lyase
MLEREEYPPGVPCWVDTGQPDPEAATAFYGGLFEWEFEDRMPADMPGRYFTARLDGQDVAGIGSQQEGAPATPAWGTYIAVESADDSAAKAREAGGTLLMEPFDVLDAGRMAVLADPSGAVFCLWQAGNHHGARVVNAPGSWNWSDLHTRDIERAKAFYAELFGWVADTVDFGEGEVTMLRRPGYGDFLERSDPDIRRRQSEYGAPAGFEDAVAWLIPMTDETHPPEMPSHWSVTFAVTDTDGMAARAAELGGTVLAAPYDVGPARVAGLADPQGAAFVVSAYKPE